MMKLERKGRIFKVDKHSDWMWSHSACPVPYNLESGKLRIFFGTRDQNNHPSVAYIDVSESDPSVILSISKNPILKKGKPGMFDDNGVYPGCLFKQGNELLMLYMGRSNGVPPLYNMSIGLAKSNDNGETFERVFEGPILTKSIHDPWMVSTPFLYKQDETFVLFYLSGQGWNEDLTKSFYYIKQTISKDLINWSTPEDVISLNKNESNIASPYYFKEGTNEFLSFCVVPDGESYHLEIASREQGQKKWLRLGKDNFVQREDWDNQCQAYPQGIKINNRHLLFYSGNSLGKEGIGYYEISK